MRLTKGLFERSYFFKELDSELVDSLSAIARLTRMTKNQVLFMEGEEADGFYAIQDGVLKVSHISQLGDERVIAILERGDIVGEMGLLDGGVRSATVTAASEARLIFIRSSEFFALADSKPAIFRHMLTVMSRRLREETQAQTAQSFLNMEGRLAKVFSQLVLSFGEEDGQGGFIISHKITQNDLGSMARVARENVNRTLKDWKEEGWLSKEGRFYKISDMRYLERLMKT
jgi:CRP/FNR family transcriptional regulator, cyclic AMP receptor protein